MSDNKVIEEIDDFDDFELDGVGLVPIHKAKEAYTEPLFLIYFNESGGSKGKFMSMAVDTLDIRAIKTDDNTQKETKFINLSSTKKDKYFYVYNSTDLDIELKRKLSNNYLISLTAQECKRIYEANGLVDGEGKILKEACFFSLIPKIVNNEDLKFNNQKIFILKKSDIPVPKVEPTPEKIIEKEIVSKNGKTIHAEFKLFATKNGLNTNGKGVYMTMFQAWKREQKTVKAVEAVTKTKAVKKK